MSDKKNWYCIYTKPNQEDHVCKKLAELPDIELLNPKLKRTKYVRKKLAEVVEELFPCYIFVQCFGSAWNDIRYVTGVSTIVRFGERIATVPDVVIAELKECFEAEEPLEVEDRLFPGAEVSIADGAFRGFKAIVLRMLPARQRVQILLDILGRQTLVEVDRASVTLENLTMAERLPSLAAAAI